MCKKCSSFLCCCLVEDSLSDSDDNINKQEQSDASTKLAFFPYHSMNQYMGVKGASEKVMSNYHLIGTDGFVYLRLNAPLSPRPENIDQNDEFEKVDRRALYQQHKNALPNKGSTAGWKVHISVSHEGDSMEKAWQLLQKICAHYELQFLKTPFPSLVNDLEPGKEFCLYLFKNTHITDWSEILNVIEYVFKKNGIISNHAPVKIPGTRKDQEGNNILYNVDKKITDSRFLYYRNDAPQRVGLKAIRPEDAVGYIEANWSENEEKKFNAYNPHNFDDILNEVKIGKTHLPKNNPFKAFKFEKEQVQENLSSSDSSSPTHSL